ncbi:MAG: sigma-70 family RNA polymerase sigma factor [Kiritimatiellae bacterium]|nr:sigma-70 family RNA polymerase sigma factor [Kiritimatiellia bacterium]
MQTAAFFAYPSRKLMHADPTQQRDDLLRLLVKHNGMLSGYIYAMVEDWDIVEETLQETAVFMANRWQDFTPGTNFTAWARTVARNRCREILRGTHRQRRISEALEACIPEETWDEHGAYDAEKKKALIECLGALPEKSRRIMDLHYRAGKRGAEIAKILRQSVESLYMALSRIRQALKTCIEERLAG